MEKIPGSNERIEGLKNTSPEFQSALIKELVRMGMTEAEFAEIHNTSNAGTIIQHTKYLERIKKFHEFGPHDTLTLRLVEDFIRRVK